MKDEKNKIKARVGSFLFLICALMLSVMIITPLPPVRAAGPTISHSTASNSCNGGGAGNTLSFTCNMTVQAGDIIILSAGWLKGSVGAGTTFTPSDSAANTYVQIATKSSQCGNPNNDWCQSWMYDVASALTTGSITFTFTFGATGFIAGDLWDISGGSLTGLTFNTGNANTQPMQVTPFVSSGSISLAAYICDGCSGTTSTPETGFSLVPNQPTGASNGFWQYAIQSTTAASNNEQCKITMGNLIAFAGVCISFLGSASNCSSSSTCTTITTVTVGNVEVVALQWSTELTGVLTVTDTLGNTYKPAIPAIELTSCDGSGCINGHTISTSIFTSGITTGGSTTITVTMSASTTTIGIVVYSVANVNPTPACSAGWSTTSGVTSTVIATATSCASIAGSTQIASIGGIGAFGLTGGASFTITTTTPSGNFGAESATITGSTVFPASIASATVVSEIGVVLSPTPSNGAVSLGSCPTKNTATTALTNSTVFFWIASALTNEQVNTLQTEVASVNSGHISSETLALGVYATPSAGGVSANNPLQLIGNSFKFFTLTPTAVAQSVSWAANVNLGGNGIIAGATIAIAIQGNSKIVINQSSLSGMQTASGTIGAGNQFTALSASGTQLFFCATLNYQVIVTTTLTTTSTSTSTSTTTAAGSTTTTTITNINPASQTNLPLVFLFLFLPAGIFLGITRNLSGGLLGLIVGAVVCVATGILSPFILTGLIIGCVAIAFIVSRGGPNG